MHWYTWRDQMRVLSAQYRVVAVDQRGYDLSGRPPGIEQYVMPLLVDDIGAVIKAERRSQAVIVGHDWGGAVAWTLAMTTPIQMGENWLGFIVDRKLAQQMVERSPPRAEVLFRICRERHLGIKPVIE